MSSRVFTDVELSHKRRGFILASVVLIFLTVALQLTGVSRHSVAASLAPAVLTWSAVLLTFAFRFWRRKERGSLELTADHVVFAGRPVLARSAVKKAFGFGSKGTSAVRVVTNNELDFAFARPEEAADFLAALAQSAGDTTATFHAFAGGQWAQSWFLSGAMLYAVTAMAALTGGMVNGLVPRGSSAWVPLGFALLILLPIFAARQLIIRRLVVGTDGILVRLPFGRSEFVPFARIEGARAEKNELRLSVHGEPSARRFALGGVRRLTGVDADVPIRALVQRIEEARRRGQAGELGAASSALLARGQRSLAEWRTALAQIADSAATFRTAAIPRDQLWRVVEDATATTELRAGAALALRHEIGDDERTRFRLAGKVSAEPALSKVFLAVGADDEVDLTAALTALEAKTSTSL